jgi:hypothetical protein
LADVHDMDEESEEDEPSVVPLGGGSAELLPKQEQMKMEATVPARARVREGGDTELQI